MIEKYLHTDLACELKENGTLAVEGVEHRQYRSPHGYGILETLILTDEAASSSGRPRGKYITVDCGLISGLGDSDSDVLAEIISEKLGELIDGATGRRRDGNFRILVVGLGNSELTADSVGPSTVSRITATNHIAELDQELFKSIGCCKICAFAPGVMGVTGVESLDLIKGAVKYTHPHAIIAIDALAASDIGRLSATVQMSDSGISPGSGIGNRRCEISKRTLGIPVISVGVPTVVDSSTLVYSVLERAGVDNIVDELGAVLEKGRGFFVSPKDSDTLNRRAACILANAIDMTFGINRAHFEYN
jgi:spore protease